MTAPSSPSKPAREAIRHQPHRFKTLPPLSPLTFFRRNIWRVLPVGGAIVISAFLIAAIVTLLNSVDATIRTHYGAVSRFSILAPQLENTVNPDVLKRAKAFPDIKQVIVCVPYFVLLKTVFGEMPVPIYGVAPEDVPPILKITRNRVVEGRLPRVNEPEIALSRAWANNFGLKLGSKWVPNNERLPSLTSPQTVVGILDGGDYIGLSDKAYLQLELPPVVQRPSHLFLPTSQAKMPGLSARIRSIIDEPQKLGLTKDQVRYVRVFTFDGLVGELRRSLAFLYRFLAFADFLVIGAVALLSGFLANIFFEQRLGEFGLLSALGFRRERLARRLIIETGSLVLISWAIGLGLTAILFKLLDNLYMQPNGLTLAKIDKDAFLYTFPIPIIVGFASLATVLTRLYRFDPIEIMERR